MGITHEQLQRFVGWQMQVMDPNDEGTFFQGPITAIAVSSGGNGHAAVLRVEMPWMAVMSGASSWFPINKLDLLPGYQADLDPSDELREMDKGCWSVALPRCEQVLSFFQEGARNWLDPDTLPWLQENQN